MKFIEISIRHWKLVNLLKIKNSTFKEIESYLRDESEPGLDLNISQRSLQRDIKIIDELYHIEIACNKATGEYFLKENTENHGSALLQHLDILKALGENPTLPEYISFEPRVGETKFLRTILNAIKKQLQVSFKHQKNYKEIEKERILAPFLLKEHDRRWYVFGMDMHKHEHRIFGLDRIKELKITDISFDFSTHRSPKSYFEYTYGVELVADSPMDIYITLTSFQANFLKSVPLHPTQTIISENDKTVTFNYQLTPKHNFVMKLLGYGQSLINVEPIELRKKLLDQIKNLNQNLKTSL